MFSFSLKAFNNSNNQTCFVFNDAMPTRLIVSHKGKISVNFPEWHDDVQSTITEVL